MICTRCADDPCTCAKTDKRKQQWLIQYCQTPGCDVAIRVKIEEPLSQPICQWCAKDLAYNTRPHPLLHSGAGEPMSKEEFGLDLFEAIRLQTAMRQAFTTARLYRDKDKPKAAEHAERAIVDLQKQLEALLQKNTIAPADLQRLLAIQ